MAADDACRQELSLRIRDDLFHLGVVDGGPGVRIAGDLLRIEVVTGRGLSRQGAVPSSSGLRLVGYLLDSAAPVSCGRYRRPRSLPGRSAQPTPTTGGQPSPRPTVNRPVAGCFMACGSCLAARIRAVLGR